MPVSVSLTFPGVDIPQCADSTTNHRLVASHTRALRHGQGGNRLYEKTRRDRELQVEETSRGQRKRSGRDDLAVSSQLRVVLSLIMAQDEKVLGGELMYLGLEIAVFLWGISFFLL
jgi:hypothetical protein